MKIPVSAPHRRRSGAGGARLRRPRDWHPLIQREEQRLLVLGGRRLNKNERNEVIATERGTIRTPRAMALRLLHVSCRPRQDFADFRRALQRVKPGPSAL